MSDKNIIESGEKTAPAAEEENKIERMAQIQQTMHIPVSAASSQKSELPPLRRRMMETRMLDIPVTDNPPPPVPDEPEEHKQKMSQIREALAMVEHKPQQQTQPSSRQALPPLKKKGSKSRRIQNAASETVVTPSIPQTASTAPKSAARAAVAAPSEAQPSGKNSSLPPLRKASAASSFRHTPLIPAASPETKAENPEVKTTVESKSQKVRKKLSIGKICAVFGCAAVGALVLSYVIMALSYRNKFLPNTYINDIPVAGMTQEEAQQALLESVRADNLQFVTPKGEEVEFAADAFSAKYALSENALEETAVENSFTWPCKLFTRSDYTVTFDFSFSEDSLHKLIEDYDWGDEESQNACIVRSDDGTYEIQPETLGDQFDVNQLLTYAVSQIETGNTRIVMEDSGCYESYRAEIVSSDLTSQLALCNQYASCTITFDFSDRQKTIDGEMISEWVKMDEDGNIDFDTAAIAEFVAQMADETDTYGRDHSFYATLDGWITVPWTSSSIYGWQIDQTSTTEQILELLQAGESATVEPVYTNWGYAYSRATDDIGNTYVEVDISAQHVWYYKDGALVMDTDCVTGLQSDPERQTPCGIFKIWSHESPRKLGTYAVQGYETWVDYWMPVTYTGIGLHDLDRSAYGGNIYLTNGSHGCINLPHDFAASLFDSTVNGIPVIIHE